MIDVIGVLRRGMSRGGIVIAALALVTALIAVACDNEEAVVTASPTATPVPQASVETTSAPEPVAQADIVDIAVNDGRFTTLVAALEAAGLVETLQGEGPFTVFAPTDEAFAKLPEGTVESLLGDIPALTDILLYHVVAGAVSSEQVVTLDSAETVQGASLAISVDGGTVSIGEATVLIADIEASNGIIHVIDAVLIPQVATEPEPVVQPDIVEIAVSDGRFTTLVAALEAAGLVETLQGEGPFTVFAPTDEAFAKLPEGTVESLLGDIPALTDILLYHVVAGAVTSEQVVTLDSAETVQGASLAISVDGGTVSIGEATVLIADIEASNGVIHVIDTVLVPQVATEMEETTEPEPVVQPDIVEIAVGDGRFTTLVAALEAAGLVETLQGEGPFTVFAPTDEAFAKLPEGTVESFLQDIPALTDILLYHVVAGAVSSEQVVTLDSAETVQGESLTISVDGGTVSIGEATVLIADIEASNGIIHVIDAVLIPQVATEPEPAVATDIVEIAVSDGRFTTLVAALEAAGLVETLQGEGPFTVFAPTDEAFAKLPEGTVESLLQDIPALTDILLYHVVAGAVTSEQVVTLDSAETVQGGSLAISVSDGTVSIGEATVLIADIEASNGIIHVIDSVLIPQPATAMEETTEPEVADIVEIAVNDGRFTTLVAALEAAGLVETLQGEGPFTVFAPTDEAFAKLPEGTVESLLGDIPALTEILLYHVVAGAVSSEQVVTLDSAETVQGASLAVSVDGGTVSIGEATVLIADIEASNGVIHVIDTVLVPSAN